MAQNDLGSLPDPTTGAALATALKDWRDALHSQHKGASRPSYAVAGLPWFQEISSSEWRMLVWDGADADILIGTLNPVANTWVPSIAASAITNVMIAANTIALNKLARVGTAGQVLTSGGSMADASMQDLPSAADRVAKAGDTMTGNLVQNPANNGKFRASGNGASGVTGFELSSGADLGGFFVRDVNPSVSGSGNGVASITFAIVSGVLNIVVTKADFSTPGGGGGGS